MRQQDLRDALGRAIRDARAAQGLTQAALAERLRLRRTSVTNIESGVQGLSVELLVEIAAALGTSPQGLLTQALDAARPDGRQQRPMDMWISSITRTASGDRTGASPPRRTG